MAGMPNPRGRGNTLPAATLQRLRRLLEAGATPTEVARDLGVDRKTVWRYRRQFREEAAPVRCSCGARLVAGERSPCRACRVRARQRRLRIEPPPQPPPDGYCEVCGRPREHAWEGVCTECREAMLERVPKA